MKRRSIPKYLGSGAQLLLIIGEKRRGFMFKCDPEKYSCSIICCKKIKNSPVLSIKDLKNVADSLECSISDAWKEYGSIINVSQKGGSNLMMGIRYSPFCGLLDDSRCMVHAKKPFQCEIYPSAHTFSRDGYACLKNKLDREQLLEKEKRIYLHNKELIRDSSYLFEGIELEEKVSSADLCRTIVDSLGIYYSINSRKNEPKLILAMFEKMDNASEEEKKLYMVYIISSYIFIKNYLIVQKRLDNIKFDENNNATNLKEIDVV